MSMSELYLVIEASTSHGSIALIEGRSVIASESVLSRDPTTGARLEGMAPAIARLFDMSNRLPASLTGIVCGSGPGGFTSLRGAAAIAKGMCFALGVPLYAVSAPELIVAERQLETGVYMTALDAGRNEVYTTVVDVIDMNIERVSDVHIVPRAELAVAALEAHATLVEPLTDGIDAPQASAAVLLLDRILSHGSVALDRWEPRYGRLAEAQVKWEATHGRPLPV